MTTSSSFGEISVYSINYQEDLIRFVEQELAELSCIHRAREQARLKKLLIILKEVHFDGDYLYPWGTAYFEVDINLE